MKRIEISPRTIDRFDEVAGSMAGAYQEAFAGEPWNEASRCIATTCSVGFNACPAGTSCPECGDTLVEAYDRTELATGWRDMVLDEDAFMQIAINENGDVVSATIARPTDPGELALRKYTGDDTMTEWLDTNLPRSFVWIEDTFANRNLQPRGNLAQRGQTLARIALRYRGDDIATRTVAPQIIRATIRDAGRLTDMYVGTRGAGSDRADLARKLGTVPDWRTLLAIDGKGLSS